MTKEIKELREFTLQLSLLKGIGPKTFKDFLLKSDINDIYKNSSEIFAKYKPINDYKFVLDNLIKQNISYVCLWEETYPTNLKEIADPPTVLYYKGVLKSNLIKSSFSIVGTRNISQYGLKYTNELTSDLTNKGYSIVSGMAFGVDRQAHISCIQNNGYTVAVLASSPDIATPQTNYDVYRKILDSGGLIISESFPGRKVYPGMFANRNRIVAGLSLGTVVIEAGEKSGALITADLAFNYGRELFALPGDVNNPGSIGTNKLIRDSKAKLITSVDDILIEYGHLTKDPKETILEKKNLSFQEESVYNAILSEPSSIDILSIKTKKDVQEVISICSLLELKGYILKDEVGNYYII